MVIVENPSSPFIMSSVTINHYLPQILSEWFIPDHVNTMQIDPKSIKQPDMEDMGI